MKKKTRRLVLWGLPILLAAIAAAVILALVLRPPQRTGLLWFAVKESEDHITPAALGCEDYYGALDAGALLDALMDGPRDPLLESPFQGAHVLSWELNQEGTMTVDLSEEYGGLSGVDLTLADYCITLTLSQLPGVEQVRTLVDGEELPYRSKQVFNTEDVIFSGTEEEPVEVDVTLYFPRQDGAGLGSEGRTLTLTEDMPVAQGALEALLQGPEDTALRAAVTHELTVLAVRLDESSGICYMNFSIQWWDCVPEDLWEQRLMLFSIVNTLCSMDKVTQVQLLVDGAALDTLGGLNISGPVAPDWTLVGAAD